MNFRVFPWRQPDGIPTPSPLTLFAPPPHSFHPDLWATTLAMQSMPLFLCLGQPAAVGMPHAQGKLQLHTMQTQSVRIGLVIANVHSTRFMEDHHAITANKAGPQRGGGRKEARQRRHAKNMPSETKATAHGRQHQQTCTGCCLQQRENDRAACNMAAWDIG